jgi:hypothetical protein
MNSPLSRQALRAPEHRAATPPVQVQAPTMTMRLTTSIAPPSLAGLKVSSPHDAVEREAAQIARRVVSLPPAPVSKNSARFAGLVPASAQRDAIPASAPSARTTSAPLPGLPGGGQPLSRPVRDFMEPRFAADFSAVRIHTGPQAARASRQLNAAAFTVGRQIVFGRDSYQPDSITGRELIAHELTHTIQQGAAPQVQRSLAPVVSERSDPAVQRLGIGDAMNYFAEHANTLPGFRMLTLALGVNPINMRAVDRSPANLLRAVVELIPGGALITQALDNHGIIERVAGWVNQQIATLGLVGSSIRQAVDRFLDGLGWRDIFDLGGVWERASRIVTEPIGRITRFACGLVSGVLQFIREAILRPLAGLAANTRGWDLLCAVLGRNPISGEPVQRTAATLIGGFMRLIGQEEIWQNIQRGNAIARAFGWFQGALAGLMGFVTALPGLFMDTLRRLGVADLVSLPQTFARIARVFGDFAGRFFNWAGQQVMSLLQIIFEVVAPSVMPYLRRASSALRTIIADPIRFIGNLVRAGVQGLRQFAANILTHLRSSLIGWLTGAMGGTGIYLPQAFTLPEIVKFVLSVLGLTWQTIRGKLVRAIGEAAVNSLETGFDLVVTLVREGPAAAWQKIQETLGNLRDMVMEQVLSFVRTNIVTVAITRLVSSLNPAGAFIQAIIAIYNTVMFFTERMRQIAQVAAAVIDSIAAIASGAIAAAANRVEQTMAGLLTLVISFLARLVGLGRVSDAVSNIINRLRAPIDRAMDRVVEWVVSTARRLGRFITGERRETADASAEDAVLVPFSIGREQHSMRTEVRQGRLTLRLSSELVMDFSERLQRIRDEWIPLRRGHPAGDLRAELNALAQDGATLVVDANRRRTERGRRQAINTAINQLATRLRDICRRFEIGQIEGVSNYVEAPPHAPAYAPCDRYGRAQGMSVSLSFRSRPSMRATNPGSVQVPGTAIAGYQRGHLLAASLGGSNADPANFAAMSPTTNTSRGGIVTFESSLRTALQRDDFPPWIVHYAIRCNYRGGESALEDELARLVGPAPGAGSRLFQMAARNAPLDVPGLTAALGGPTSEAISANQQRIRDALLRNFVPRSFAVSVRIEQSPQGGTLPASQPFDNHM